MQYTNQRQQFNTNSSNQIDLLKQSSKEQNKSFPQLQRKTSKRREFQQQRVIVFDLFKQLIAKINQGYSHISTLKVNKNSQIRVPRIPKQKTRGKQGLMRQKKQIKGKKNTEQYKRLQVEKKEQMWANYSVLMNYQIVVPQSEIRPVAIVDQTQQ